MKITFILLLSISLLGMNNITYAQVTTSNKVLWADVQSFVPLDRDTSGWYAKSGMEKLISTGIAFQQNWDIAFKYDSEKIFSSITHAVLSGKLKAYTDFSTLDKALTLKEFNNILVHYDTTDTPMNAMTYDGSDGLVPIGSLIKLELKADDIARLKFNEKIEFDTVANSLSTKISSITFYTYNLNENGQAVGEKEKFFVKLNE